MTRRKNLIKTYRLTIPAHTSFNNFPAYRVYCLVRAFHPFFFLRLNSLQRSSIGYENDLVRVKGSMIDSVFHLSRLKLPDGFVLRPLLGSDIIILAFKGSLQYVQVWCSVSAASGATH